MYFVTGPTKWSLQLSVPVPAGRRERTEFPPPGLFHRLCRTQKLFIRAQVITAYVLLDYQNVTLILSLPSLEVTYSLWRRLMVAWFVWGRWTEVFFFSQTKNVPGFHKWTCSTVPLLLPQLCSQWPLFILSGLWFSLLPFRHCLQ